MLKNEGKLLGVDYGSKQVGVAISNESQSVAFPEGVSDNQTALSYIENICKKRDIVGIVLGESTDYSGEDNPIMEEIREFKAILEEKLDIPIYFEPEFLTTKQASRSQKDRDDLDASAAAIILRSFLEKRKNQQDE